MKFDIRRSPVAAALFVALAMSTPEPSPAGQDSATETPADTSLVSWTKGRPSRPFALFVEADIDPAVVEAVASGELLDSRYRYRRRTAPRDLVAEIRRACEAKRSWFRAVDSAPEAEVSLTILFTGKFKRGEVTAVGQIGEVRLPDGTTERITYVGTPRSLERGLMHALEELLEERAK